MVHEVYIGNLGCAYRGLSKDEATTAYDEYVGLSKADYGRVSNETVTQMEGGEIVQEHFPENQSEEE